LGSSLKAIEAETASINQPETSPIVQQMVGHMIQPRLHLVEDMFVPPSLLSLPGVHFGLSEQVKPSDDGNDRCRPFDLSVRFPWSAFAQLGRCSDRSQRRK